MTRIYEFKRIVIFGFLTIIIAGGIWFAFRQNDSEQVNDGQDLEQVQEYIEEGGPAFHPVSLPALMEKDWDGRDLELGQVLAENESYTRYYITYKSGDLTISGIMNVPKGAGPFPLLALNHGYIDPAVYSNGRGLRREQDYLARRGYVVLHPDYRNHADSSKDSDAELKLRLGYVEDVISAVYAAKNSSLDFIDADRVGMLGHSMGGGIALNTLVVDPDLADAAVLFAPVNGDFRDSFDRWIRRRPETAQKILEEYGTFEESPEFWEDVVAYNFLNRVQAPVMIHHGTADESVPIAWSEDMQRRFTEAEIDSIFHIYEGQPHEFTSAWSQVMQRTVEFFDKFLE